MNIDPVALEKFFTSMNKFVTFVDTMEAAIQLVMDTGNKKEITPLVHTNSVVSKPKKYRDAVPKNTKRYKRLSREGVKQIIEAYESGSTVLQCALIAGCSLEVASRVIRGVVFSDISLRYRTKPIPTGRLNY